MNKLRRLFVVNKTIDCYCNIRLLLAGNHSKLYFSALSAKEEFGKAGKQEPEKNYIDILLDNIPPSWNSTQIPEKSDTTNAFKEWIKLKNLSEQDGKMLNRLKEHIINGGHPDFPRLYKTKDGEKCLKHMTDDYFTSIDTECFEWLKKQKALYQKRTIHPWLQWKLEQLNVTLEWYLLSLFILFIDE